MWDVNQVLIFNLPKLATGLIWTMWDVNIACKTSWNNVCAKFDLNYVGCELCLWRSFRLTLALFDLNYVGCERGGNSFCIRTSETSLIWTMWDVNFVRKTLPRRKDAFDLNYVGCEPRTLTEEIYNIVGLIWTMWDVNELELPGHAREVFGLIWTMWDVNFVYVKEYVVVTPCLIWTMWDVNHNNRSYVVDADVGLIWTMWDVNIFNWSYGNTFINVWSELCGMWTGVKYGWFYELYLFDLNYVGCEPEQESDWKKHSSCVWSELCGMWTIDHWKKLGRSEKFDLNYVGCELRQHRYFLERIQRAFDLNYVGCEPCIWRYYVELVVGLIWTMWDVN